MTFQVAPEASPMHSPCFRSSKPIAALLALALCLGVTRPAHAEDKVPAAQARAETASERTNLGLWSTEKKVLLVSTFGVGVASLGVSTFAFIKSRSAAQDEKEEFPYGDCGTIASCDRLRTLVRNDRVWMDRGLALSGVGLGLIAGTFLMAFILPNGQTTTISPSASASKDGASFSLAGRF